jgi:hypothetical protein
VGQVRLLRLSPKSGAPCTKSGLVKTYQGKKFTCIGSGKKLVWSKGVSTKSTPIASTSGSTQASTPTPSPSPTPVLTLAEKWALTGSRALEGFNQAFPQKSAQYPTLETVWRISEQVDPRISTEIQKQYKESIDFWSAYTKHQGVLQVIVGTLDDVEFICKWRSSYLDMPAPNCTSSFRTDKSRSWDAHTTQTSTKATDFYFMTDPATLMESNFLPRVPHEFFHNVQWAQTVRYKSLLPCWAEEGGAEYFGILVSSQGDLEEFLKRRYQPLTDSRGKLMRTQLTQADWKEWLMSADMNSVIPGSYEWGCQGVQPEGIYSYGLLATEYLNIKIRDCGTSCAVSRFRVLLAGIRRLRRHLVSQSLRHMTKSLHICVKSTESISAKRLLVVKYLHPLMIAHYQP